MEAVACSKAILAPSRLERLGRAALRAVVSNALVLHHRFNRHSARLGFRFVSLCQISTAFVTARPELPFLIRSFVLRQLFNGSLLPFDRLVEVTSFCASGCQSEQAMIPA